MHVALLIAALTAFAAPPRVRASPVPTSAVAQPTLPSIVVTIGENTVRAEVADSPTERSAGLMRRTDLPQGAGMLFAYPASRPLSFWMKDTLLPLSIAFIDADGRVVHMTDMQPLDESHVPSRHAALYALEVPQGWFDEHGVKVGDLVGGLPGPAPE
jgi:uncharacterized protein